MSDAVCNQMTILSTLGLFGRMRETIAEWRKRAWERASLLELEDRDLHDLGMSRGAANFEAGKPFWRA